MTPVAARAIMNVQGRGRKTVDASYKLLVGFSSRGCGDDTRCSKSNPECTGQR